MSKAGEITPLPWKVNRRPTGMNDDGTIESSSGLVIAPTIYGQSAASAEANAAYIAQACNAFPAMRDALQAAHAALDVWVRSKYLGGTGDREDMRVLRGTVQAALAASEVK